MTYPTKTNLANNDLINILDSEDSHALKFIKYGHLKGLVSLRSLSFSEASSQYLSRNWGAGGTSRQKATISFFVKRQITGDDHIFSWADPTAGNRFRMIFGSDNKLAFYAETSGGNDAALVTSMTVSDEEWHHVVLACDTTQATASDRIKIYFDGTRITSFSTEIYPTQNYNFHINNGNEEYRIGNQESTSVYFTALLDEFIYVDGQQLEPNDFAANNVPIEYQGTYGVKGFRLNFEDNTSTATLGEDSSGNGNDWVLVNMTANNSSLDVPE